MPQTGRSTDQKARHPDVYPRFVEAPLIARDGRVTRIGGRRILRLAKNPATEDLYAKIQHAPAA